MKRNLVKTLLRIITPEEIQELTTLPEVHHKESLTSLICEKIEQDVADGKLIDIPTYCELEENETPVPLSFKTDKKGVEFILEFKKKMQAGRKKLAQKASISAYHENLAVNFLEEEDEEEDIHELSSSTGILVNKKRY